MRWPTAYMLLESFVYVIIVDAESAQILLGFGSGAVPINLPAERALTT